MDRNLDRRISILAESAARRLTRRRAIAAGIKTGVAAIAGIAIGQGLGLRDAEAICTCNWAGATFAPAAHPAPVVLRGGRDVNSAIRPWITAITDAVAGVTTPTASGCPAPGSATAMATESAPTARATALVRISVSAHACQRAFAAGVQHRWHDACRSCRPAPTGVAQGERASIAHGRRRVLIGRDGCNGTGVAGSLRMGLGRARGRGGGPRRICQARFSLRIQRGRNGRAVLGSRTLAFGFSLRRGVRRPGRSDLGIGRRATATARRAPVGARVGRGHLYPPLRLGRNTELASSITGASLAGARALD